MGKFVTNFNRPDLSRGDGVSRKSDAAAPAPADRVARMKAPPDALAEYREAWIELSGRNPRVAQTLPHPDSTGFDPVKALELLRRVGGPTPAVPPRRDIQARR